MNRRSFIQRAVAASAAPLFSFVPSFPEPVSQGTWALEFRYCHEEHGWAVVGSGNTLLEAAAELERQIEVVCGCWVTEDDQYRWFEGLRDIAEGDDVYHARDMGDPDNDWNMTVIKRKEPNG